MDRSSSLGTMEGKESNAYSRSLKTDQVPNDRSSPDCFHSGSRSAGQQWVGLRHPSKLVGCNKPRLIPCIYISQSGRRPRQKSHTHLPTLSHTRDSLIRLLSRRPVSLGPETRSDPAQVIDECSNYGLQTNSLAEYATLPVPCDDMALQDFHI